MSTAKVDLFKLARVTNWLIVAFAILFFLAGWRVSYWFHFLTVFFLMLAVMNFFYRHVQKRHAILRNFGILGQMRYILESVGPELRQYLFASDTEERPFDRVTRSEVYRKAKGVDSAMSFGSSLDHSVEVKRYPITPRIVQQSWERLFVQDVLMSRSTWMFVSDPPAVT